MIDGIPSFSGEDDGAAIYLKKHPRDLRYMAFKALVKYAPKRYREAIYNSSNMRYLKKC